MGRLFLEHLGGETIFECLRCRTYLTNNALCLSDTFQGATGPAYLFDRVVNVVYSELEVRTMITGKHVVRDVLCKNCKMKLGWIYELAYEEQQSYKEGHVILEKKLMHVEVVEDHSLAMRLQPRMRCVSNVSNSGSSIESSELGSSEETIT